MRLSPPARGTGVLHVTQPVDGGVARVVTDLTRDQAGRGLRVEVACPEGRLAAELRSLGARVHPWPATRSLGPALAGEVRRLTRIVGEARPDLVHAHSAKAGLAGRLALRGRVPTVFQPHAWSFEAVDGRTAALAREWERWAARWTARTVCVSEAERRRGERAGVRGPWSVVPNGVDTDRFRPAPETGARGGGTGAEPPAGPAPARLAPGGPLVVCVGRLCRQKGQDVLLAAWRRVSARLPGARLALVGDGPERARLAEAAPASVLFAGNAPDPLPWYRAADLVVLPSRWEGMALAPLEALACGRPVVVTDVDGARESLPAALAPYGLVPAGDPAALAGAVTALLADAPLLAALGRAGREHVLATHDVRHTARSVAAVYREVLDGPAPTERVPSGGAAHRPSVSTDSREAVSS
ncbi:glycosyltransferase [Streptomyces tagetis]|uniref:Glycosyltransferase n=1 Tax=Streptomyces tagetis TaxID=2820809 RepID=A0A940XIT5_9ACTN|nr:glycosyltransferase [Streptomyces sp. RG38]MBQ0829189.1 glycosyltransferase [Streptomyces sp. RG38]